MKKSLFLAFLCLFCIKQASNAQTFQMPKNPEDRIQFKVESDLKKMLKQGNDSAFAVLLRHTTGDFFDDYKDYKTLLNFLEDLENPTDSLAFWHFRILIAGGYGTKPKLKDAQELFEKSNFKNWLLSYSHKEDLPFTAFFDTYQKAQQDDLKAQVLLARYFLEYQISYSIGMELLKKNTEADAQYLAQKWDLAKKKHEINPLLCNLSIESLKSFAEKGSHLAKMSYGKSCIESAENTQFAKNFLKEFATDSLLAPKALAIRCQLSKDKDQILALQEFYATYKNTIWSEKFEKQLSDWEKLDKNMKDFSIFTKINAEYGLGFKQSSLLGQNANEFSEVFLEMQKPENAYLNAYLPIYQEALNQKFFQSLQAINDLENALIWSKKLNDSTTQNLMQTWKAKNEALLEQKIANILLQQNDLYELEKYAQIFDKQGVAYNPNLSISLQNTISQTPLPYWFFLIKHDEKLRVFVEKFCPDVAVFAQKNTVFTTLSDADSAFYELHAQIAFQKNTSLEQANTWFETMISKNVLLKDTKDSLRHFLAYKTIENAYGKTPNFEQIEVLQNSLLSQEWLKDIKDKIIFGYTSDNPNFFQANLLVDGLHYFYQVYLNEKDNFQVVIRRKDGEVYNDIYKHYWEKAKNADFLELKIANFLEKDNGTRTNSKTDYLLVRCYPNLQTDLEIFGKMAALCNKKPIQPKSYELKALVRATVLYVLEGCPMLLK